MKKISTQDKIAYSVGAVIVLFFIIFITWAVIVALRPPTRTSEKEGCAICGDEIYAGLFCEKHFNDWVKDFDEDNKNKR